MWPWVFALASVAVAIAPLRPRDQSLDFGSKFRTNMATYAAKDQWSVEVPALGVETRPDQATRANATSAPDQAALVEEDARAGAHVDAAMRGTPTYETLRSHVRDSLGMNDPWGQKYEFIMAEKREEITFGAQGRVESWKYGPPRTTFPILDTRGARVNKGDVVLAVNGAPVTAGSSITTVKKGAELTVPLNLDRLIKKWKSGTSTKYDTEATKEWNENRNVRIMDAGFAEVDSGAREPQDWATALTEDTTRYLVLFGEAAWGRVKAAKEAGKWNLDAASQRLFDSPQRTLASDRSVELEADKWNYAPVIELKRTDRTITMTPTATDIPMMAYHVHANLNVAATVGLLVTALRDNEAVVSMTNDLLRTMDQRGVFGHLAWALSKLKGVTGAKLPAWIKSKEGDTVVNACTMPWNALAELVASDGLVTHQEVASKITPEVLEAFGDKYAAAVNPGLYGKGSDEQNVEDAGCDGCNLEGWERSK